MNQPIFSTDQPELTSSPCLQGERVTFTGTLASLTHAEAAQLVEENGGTATDYVSRQLTMLVIGEEGWPLEDNGQPSVKLQQVSSARRLSDLMNAGITREEILDSLKQLPSVRRGDERPLEQLQILAHSLGVLVRDSHGLVMPASGQRVFDFDSEPEFEEPVEPTKSPSTLLNNIAHSPDAPVEELNRDWLVEGCRLYDAGNVADALEAFRLAAMSSPQSSDVHFQLGECLYRLGNIQGALERYYAAAEHDRDFLEAWTQIGCLHNELEERTSARTAFQVALSILPEYPDAHYHLAETLNELGETALARQHWQEYLKHDHRGPWADIARARLDNLG
ncbi:unnamed protein product [Durusdinium trenchii]|uniref:BRCT domain-containing protein n=1 Tax=Durusdinium trenchii TaxID=1381693 RepID=A0ABP0S855_9DINO